MKIFGFGRPHLSDKFKVIVFILVLLISLISISATLKTSGGSGEGGTKH